MANNIRGTVVVVDSAGNIQWPGDGDSAKVSQIAFYGTNTTSTMQLSVQGANSGAIVVNMRNPVNDPSVTHSNFTENVSFGKMRVMTLTAGSGWIYLA